LGNKANIRKRPGSLPFEISHERLGQLLDLAQIIPWEADAESWRFTYVGTQAVAILGYPVEHWYKKDFWVSHLHLEDREEAIRFCEESSAHLENFTFEYRMLSANGQEVWLRDLVSVDFVDGKPKTLRGFMIDITQVKQAEEETIREKEKQLENLLSNVNVIVLEGDPFNIYYVGGQVEAILGYPKEAWFGHADGPVGFWAGLLHADDKDKLDQCIEAITQGQDHTFEYRMIRSDGEEVWFYDTVTVETRDGKPVKTRSVMIDITEQKLAQQALHESEERYHTLFNSVREYLYSVEIQEGKAVAVLHSPSCEDITGYRPDEYFSDEHLWSKMIHPDDFERVIAHNHQLLAGQEVGAIEHRIIRKDGEKRWISNNPVVRRDDEGNVIGYDGIISDITENKTAQQKLNQAAFYDNLTGLPNRALMLDRINCVIEKSKRRGEVLSALLFMDLDNFKIINDSLGHQYGDELLIEVGKKLAGCVRSGDTVARLGGDEFTVLLEEIDDFSQAMHITERILETVSRPMEILDESVSTAASIGVVIFASVGEIRAEELLRDADTAMYRAKELGRNGYQLFDVSMQESVQRRMELEKALRKAVEQEEFVLHFQPIISLASGRLEGFEALVRWERPGHGLVGPLDFIELCEEMGLIIPLGKWILRKSCEQMVEWERHFQEELGLYMSVNLSAKQFNQGHLADQVIQIIREVDFDPAKLKLEITESMVMDDSEAAITMLSQLKELGVKVSMDDFGTGYSSLSSLHKFPIDTLKIDCSFVNRMIEDLDSSRIIETILLLARNLKLTTTAEGIETIEQLEHLEKLGCESGQGYYFSKPLDSNAATEVITQYFVSLTPAS